MSMMCQYCREHSVYPFRPDVPATVIPPGFTVNDWTQYINTFIDVRIRGLYQKLLKCLPTERTNVLLKDQADPTRIYKMFIQNGAICTEEVSPESSTSSSLIDSSSSTIEHENAKNFLQFNDVITGELVNVFVYNGQLQTQGRRQQNEGQTNFIQPDELEIEQLNFDQMDVRSLNIAGKPIDEYVQDLIDGKKPDEEPVSGLIS